MAVRKGVMQLYEYNIGEGIKNIRKKHNLTQEQLAKALNVSTATIANYENNKTVPSMEFILKLSTLFGVTTDTAMGKFIEQPDRQFSLMEGVDPDTTEDID